jgi:hypothetical protein
MIQMGAKENVCVLELRIGPFDDSHNIPRELFGNNIE